MSSVYAKAYFSEDGAPKTGLSPTIDIIKVLDNSEPVSAQAMVEVGKGFYKYEFTVAAGYDPTLDWVYQCDSVILTGDEQYANGCFDSSPLVEGTETVVEVLRLIRSFICGEVTGGNTGTVSFRDLADAKDRIVMTVDKNGNRSAVVTDET